MEDSEGSMIRNVHQRNLRANINNAAALLHRLSSESDQLWPKDRWPAMKLSSGLVEGSHGGHGFVRYSVASVDPHRVVFRFDERIGLRGTHSFELEELPSGGCVLRHVLEGDGIGSMRIAWPLVVRPLHDALVEDGLDNAVRELDGDRVEKRPLTRRVKFLRSGFSLLGQQPDPTLPPGVSLEMLPLWRWQGLECFTRHGVLASLPGREKIFCHWQRRWLADRSFLLQLRATWSLPY
jgi:hypothetical protein